jgi:hypothetical protein
MRFSITASRSPDPCAAVGCDADNRGRPLRTRDASHEFPRGRIGRRRADERAEPTARMDSRGGLCGARAATHTGESALGKKREAYRRIAASWPPGGTRRRRPFPTANCSLLPWPFPFCSRHPGKYGIRLCLLGGGFRLSNSLVKVVWHYLVRTIVSAANKKESKNLE